MIQQTIHLRENHLVILTLWFISRGVFKKPVRDFGKEEIFSRRLPVPCNPEGHCQMLLMPAPPTHPFLWPTPHLFIWQSAGNAFLAKNILTVAWGE